MKELCFLPAAGDVNAFRADDVAVMLGTTTASVKTAPQRARARLEEVAPVADQISEPTAPQARAIFDQSNNRRPGR